MRLMLLLALLAAPCVYAQDDVRRGFDQLAQAHPGFIKLEALSGTNKAAFAATIRDFSVEGNLPGVLLVGSLHGREQEPGVACLRVARAILEDKAFVDQLKHFELIIIPLPNPEGRLARLEGVPLAFDDDRDGKSDEDGPSDLNGDGLITQMRVKRAGGKYVASKLDARVLIEAQPGQTGEWDVYWEGKDDDGDGRINEDARGTVTLANDWSIRWSDSQPGANRFMMQLAETRALAEFVIAHPGLTAAFQLRGVGGDPAFAQGPPRGAARSPRGEGAEDVERDKQMTGMLAKLWPEGEKSAFKGESEGAGNLLDWLYESQGVLAANLFLAPLPEMKEEEGEEGQPKTKREQPSEEESLQLAWLNYTPADYIEWKTFNHPQLGEVEVGGWRIDRRCDPKEADAEAGAGRVTEFVKAVLQAMPRLEVSKVEVEDKGDNLYRVRATLHNAGKLDYRCRFSEEKRIHMPLFLALSDTKDVELVSGTRRQQLENLGADETATFEWFVRVKGKDTELKFALESDRTGNFDHSAVIKDCPALKTEEK
ncbi:MAG: hypothetical protein H6839_05730 [Planctomycetes bacterium]|nr:hypothetical protein [Planctomycetota bacterium]